MRKNPFLYIKLKTFLLKFRFIIIYNFFKIVFILKKIFFSEYRSLFKTLILKKKSRIIKDFSQTIFQIIQNRF